jgi:lipoprotein-anchoring transpeptidase ErfK/SrfK
MTNNARRVFVAALMAASILVALPPQEASAGIAPPNIAQDYSTGLEPGTSLGGLLLPRNWSLRVSPCNPDSAPDTSTARIGQTATTMALLTYPTPLVPAPHEAGLYPALCPGEESEAVARLQQMLTEKKLYREPITGVYDEATRFAVVAFHKIIGPPHSNPATARGEWKLDPPPADWNYEDWLMLEAFNPRPPKSRPGQPDRVEVDIGHQVLYLIEHGQVAAIMPVSTGKGNGTRACSNLDCTWTNTPRTDLLEGGSTFYTAHGYANGWSPRPKNWSIYKAIFYRGNYNEWNYAIHGSGNVPSYPASHGCTRITLWDMDFLRPSIPADAPDMRVYIGMSIHVWDA